jgi:hypothetical protein
MKITGTLKGILVLIIILYCSQGHAAIKDSLLKKIDTASPEVIYKQVPEIIKIRSDNRFRGSNTVLFGDHIKFTVRNMGVFLSKLDSCMAGGKSDTLCPILLYINGMPADDIRANDINRIDSTISFELNRKSITLGKFHFDLIWSAIPVSFSFGLKGAGPVARAEMLGKTNLKYLANASLVVMISMVIAMFVTFWWLVIKTNLIRVTHSRSKYSLGLAQLLFWVFMVAFSFCYIYITTDEMYPITGSVLVLLTISLGTSGGSRLVDRARDPKRMYESASVSFLKDILSDDAGYSVNRLQMVIWTVILGCVFSYQVIVKQAMPQFDPNLLMLMGISSTGYIGLKTIEHTASEMKKVGVIPPEEVMEAVVKAKSKKA